MQVTHMWSHSNKKKDGKQELITNLKHHGLAHNYHVLNTDRQSGNFRSNVRHQFFISSCLGEQSGQSLEYWMKLVIIMRKTCNKCISPFPTLPL